MNVIPRNELEPLLQASGGPCVSIFLPTFRTGVETQQNLIRLKNLMRSAQERLDEWGMRGPEADEFLEPARRLVHDDSFWFNQSDGLALFRSSDMFKTFRLPVSFNELAVVENRFHLKPLFPLISDESHFYILALSLKNTRLLSGHRFGIQEVDLGDVPNSLNEALGDLSRRYTMMHVPTSSKSPHRAPLSIGASPVFHGHGMAEDNLKEEIRKFFRIFDTELGNKVDIDPKAPVVLAGVEYLLPIYKDASVTFKNFLDEALHGNLEGEHENDLHGAAWDIVGPTFDNERRKSVERYHELVGAGRASSEMQEILPAAHEGRVDTLFAARGVRVWGTFDLEKRKADYQRDQTAQRNGSEDLIDLAAVQAYRNGGRVFVVDQQDVPEGKALAAIFRY